MIMDHETCIVQNKHTKRIIRLILIVAEWLGGMKCSGSVGGALSDHLI